MDKNNEKEINYSCITIIYRWRICNSTSVIDIILNVYKQFFPFFKITIERKLESYLKSPYFIVSVLTFVCSIFGWVLSANNKRVIYIVISLIVLVISLVSIIGNFIICDF